jgi:hypothetical protein
MRVAVRMPVAVVIGLVVGMVARHGRIIPATTFPAAIRRFTSIHFSVIQETNP